MKNKKRMGTLGLILSAALASQTAFASDSRDRTHCPVTHADLEAQLKIVQAMGNGGFGFNMWATVVDRAGVVCAVARTGANPGDQWPASRVISAQKANTANSLSLPTFALSTANLYTAVQPGGSLFGLQESNPVDTEVAYAGHFSHYGTPHDAMVGHKIGGVNVFGGGLALYDAKGVLVGGIGVSGDSSCADHNIAWRTRHGLNLDHVPDGVNLPHHDDNIIYDSTNTNGWRHPVCGNPVAQDIANAFPKAGEDTTKPTKPTKP